MCSLQCLRILKRFVLANIKHGRTTFTHYLLIIDPDLLIGLSQDSRSHTPISEDILLGSTVDDDSIIIFSPPTTPDQQPYNVPPLPPHSNNKPPPPHSSTDTNSDDPHLLIDSSQESGTFSPISGDDFF